ncbi:Shedu immune nuclease family protein [Flavobacterium sp. M31R6]|uniref:Shedu immune nuclease family protein n=1 Tax=Flavobacterium sp. M31R6 TaxID=2739062 RepID=UPI0015692CD5|nr:Shedu immune nuclease family protein [Flavobacterium sp. M31R6]QKJ62837.1 DUF4263 domain-containing protein [Flavobacterium sp. M31R6]
MKNIFDTLDNSDFESEIPSDGNKITLKENEGKIECVIENESKDLIHSIVEIDLNNSRTTIRPINTLTESFYYFKSKYDIKEIVFEGLETSIEELDSGGYGLYGLPTGFTRTIMFGLGLEKKYKILINTILKHFEKCDKLIISNEQQTSILSNDIIISYEDFEKIRRGIDRNHDLFYKEGQIAKQSFIYDNIFYYLNPTKFPTLKIPSRKEVIYKVLRNTDFSKISKSDKSSLSILKDTTDLSYLSILMNEFEEKINGNHLESTYQTFFEENPLLLTFFSGSPYVKFKNQAYVGGKSFDNSNGQYPDFLQKHKLTNNTFIIEIKTPQTTLLDKTAYRDTGIYNPSKNLSGSITQLLTQKYQLETEISTLIKNADDRNVEAYNIQTLLIIGNLSSLTSKEMIRSFELFRNNQKNLRIVTYDECLEQIKTFISLLSKSIDECENEII